MYAVIARFDDLKVHDVPHHSVLGEAGDEPYQMEVVESGVDVQRIITGGLIAFEVAE